LTFVISFLTLRPKGGIDAKHLEHLGRAVLCGERLPAFLASDLRLLGFCCVRLGSEISGGGTRLSKEAREDWLDEAAEQDLSSIGLGEGHPKDEDELEGVVEWEPVDSIDHALEDGEEGVNDPVGQPLRIIGFACGEERLKRIVSRNDEPSKIHEEFASDIEKDQEEVEANEAEEGIDLGDGGLLLEVIEGRVFGQLLINLGDLMLSSILERHGDEGAVW